MNGIPVIDLFAGPGGLCEGFASLTKGESRCFEIRVSIEKDPVAHKTLSLRALFRSFPVGKVPAAYYQYIRGEISREQLESDPAVIPYVKKSYAEARCAELGKNDHREIDSWIRGGLAGAKEWVLIGGPPCQAYSIVGRSRMRGSNPKEFESDKRHFLYKEYLRIIKEFSPSVFVMENVKGMLTSQHSGSLMMLGRQRQHLQDVSGTRTGRHELLVLVHAVHHVDVVLERQAACLDQIARHLALGLESQFSDHFAFRKAIVFADTPSRR